MRYQRVLGVSEMLPTRAFCTVAPDMLYFGQPQLMISELEVVFTHF